MECRVVFLLLVVSVTLSWPNPQDDHVDGRHSCNISKRGLIKGTLKAVMKVHITNALPVRQAKKIILAGATFERNIRKTCPCNVYPLEPHFYIVKLGFAGLCLFFLFLLQNIDCGYSLEPPRLS